MARRVVFHTGNPYVDFGVYNGRIMSCPLCKEIIELTTAQIDRYGDSKNKVHCSNCRFEDLIRLGD